MGNSSGIKWNGVTQAQTQNTIETIGSDVQIILRDPRTEQEWVTSSVDYINALTTLGVIGSGGNWDASGNDIFNNNSGNVGIGLDSPKSKLHVLGTAAIIDGDLMATNLTGLIVDYNQYTVIQYSTASDGVTSIEVSANGAKLRSSGPTSAGQTEINLDETHFSVDDQTGGNVLIYADRTTLNVGIGTNSAASKLTVDTGDIEVIGDANGLILESPDKTRYRVTVANGGTLTVGAV